MRHKITSETKIFVLYGREFKATPFSVLPYAIHPIDNFGVEFDLTDQVLIVDGHVLMSTRRNPVVLYSEQPGILNVLAFKRSSFYAYKYDGQKLEYVGEFPKIGGGKVPPL